MRLVGTASSRRVAVVLALLAAGLTAACSPEPRYNVALLLDDGHPTALLHHCDGSPITRLSVTDQTTPSRPDPAAPQSTTRYVPWWSVEAAGSDNRPERVRLLATPTGWRQETSHPFPIEQFEEGIDYMLDTNDVGFRGLRFTLADLQSLEDGQVWALRRNGDEAAMTVEDFTTLAADNC